MMFVFHELCCSTDVLLMRHAYLQARCQHKSMHHPCADRFFLFIAVAPFALGVVWSFCLHAVQKYIVLLSTGTLRGAWHRYSTRLWPPQSHTSFQGLHSWALFCVCVPHFVFFVVVRFP